MLTQLTTQALPSYLIHSAVIIISQWALIVLLFFFFLMIRRPPRSPLFPSTPFSRSSPACRCSSPPASSSWSRPSATRKPKYSSANPARSLLAGAAPPRRDRAGLAEEYFGFREIGRAHV